MITTAMRQTSWYCRQNGLHASNRTARIRVRFTLPQPSRPESPFKCWPMKAYNAIWRKPMDQSTGWPLLLYTWLHLEMTAKESKEDLQIGVTIMIKWHVFLDRNCFYGCAASRKLTTRVTLCHSSHGIFVVGTSLEKLTSIINFTELVGIVWKPL